LADPKKTYTGRIAVGQVHGQWTVLEFAGRSERRYGRTLWRSRCSCGIEKVISDGCLDLAAKNNGGCRECFPRRQREKQKDYRGYIAVGQVYGNWTVLKHAGRTERTATKWLCRCKCGVEEIVTAYRISKIKVGTFGPNGCKKCYSKTPHAEFRTCESCKGSKPDSQFQRTLQKSGTVGRRLICKECKSILDTARKRGLSVDAVKWLLATAPSCAICKKPFTNRPRVDHCHVTGRTRALLCDGCNKGIGMMEESPAILEAAAEYLRHHHAISVLSFPSFFQEN